MRVAAFLVCAISAILGKEIKLNKHGCPIDYKIDKLIQHDICHKYYQCFHGYLVERKCSDGLLFNVNQNKCDFAKNVECKHQEEDENKHSNVKTAVQSESENNSSQVPCKCNTKEASKICAKPESDEEIVAHEHCNKFYKCSHGKNISMRCPGTLLYNPYKEWCDFPENVKCGDRVIPDPEEEDDNNSDEDDNDNKGSCNCVPGEAPSICSKPGSDGVLVAHEHCNKFYKCSHGKNITMRCRGTLLYNPYKEWCDYHENVKCGDRVIPDSEEDNDNNNSGEDDNGDDHDNKGSCNCVPGEATSICSKSGSDGILVAHEHCNKFYKCSHGKNISMRCPGTLLYNPYKEWCDFPVNVKCGDRVIPDPEEEDDNNSDEDDNDNKGSCNCVPGEAPSICSKPGSDGVLVAHEHCNKFYKCSHGKNITMRCRGTLLYNPYKEWCDYHENVKCGDRVIPDSEEDNDNNNNSGEDDNGDDHDNKGSCNCVPGEAPSICSKPGSDGVLVAHEHCNKFYKCSHGKNITMRCRGTLLYNPYKEWCDYHENVKCGDRVIPDSEEDKDNNKSGEDDNGDDHDNKGSCNCVPGEAPSICSKSGSDGILVAHEHCNKFYKCSHGKNISMRCPGTLLYNPYKEWCDFPENVKCGDRVIPDPEEEDDNNSDEDDNDNTGSCNCVPGEAPSICSQPGSDGVLVAHEHCNKFYKCSHGKNISMRCRGTLLYNPYKEWCDYHENVKCGDRVIPDSEEDNDNNNSGEDDNSDDHDNKGSCNCVPGEAPSICSKSGSDGVLVAHEHCNKFYKCSHGKNISMRCPGTLLYNPYKEWCDFPENVKCGDRVIPDPEEEDDNNSDEDDNDNTGSCNCVPGEAPSICSQPGSDGVLVAHEHCNKFYKCSHGKNISMRCRGTLLYNPYKEWCDYHENVKCGDRVIPDSEEDNDNNNSGEDDNSDDHDNKGSCNCVPGEAPSICSKSGSDGVLVAHEHCNKFYKCSHGKNISMRCPGTLLYNPYKEWCDFPENVKCGDRVIPDPEEEDDNNSDEDENDNTGSCNCVPGEAPSICSQPGSDGVLVAHEHCNKFYKCSHGKNISMRCRGTLLYNPYKEWCDYHENVKCGDRVIPDSEEDNDNNNSGEDDNSDDHDNKGSCNCVPGEAPSICSKSGSDGVLVAHEHCNKFYKCSHGKNISMRCPGTLLYNPYKEWCDFPENVKCGDRVIPDPEEEDDNNSDEDDNDNTGSCNCVPGEAPSICSKSGSDGILVAHEHCNKFYKCSHGKNISMRCPGTLLYNPYKEWCDFPENVKCGDRVIPDPEEEDDNNSDEDDNDNTGSCNCVPGEAPSICSQPGSDGVLVAHEHCNKFYKCSHGKNISMRCRGTLLYNPYKEWCDYHENVKCGDRVIPDSEEDNDNNNSGEDDNSDDHDNKGSCNCVPGDAPSICSQPGSDGVLVAHEHCNKFYKCSHGKNISMRCRGTLLYNPYKEWCDYHENVKCGDRVILDSEEDNDNNNSGEDDNSDDHDNKGSCNCVPGEAPSICSKSGSDGVLVAHEHCNKFYKCSHGKNISMRCPGTLLYNPYKEWCDFPENVKCGDRVIPDPEEEDDNNSDEDDNDNTGSCNCVPGEAPSICSQPGSDGVLVAHEHCNKFYKCSHGKNISMRCRGTLLYNPYKEWCDYHENVKCGDRVIPDSEEDNDNNNSGEDDNSDDHDNKGSCNCVPGEAPSICSKSGSDGVLVAHEHCNKFYKCSHGKNISMRCPGTLLYNPYKEWCDFPENVKCGDRVIPDPEEEDDNNSDEDDNDNTGSCNCVPGEAPSICSQPGSDGVLVAHDHCNKFYKCSHGKNISMRCRGTLLYNPYKEWCDYHENVKCGDRVIPDSEEDNDNNNSGEDDNSDDHDNKGSCNCVPGEAPSICSKSGSDGVLVAHEHCNKFYKCSHGKNISMRCPGTLLYNPYKEWCDFPENVKCGDRVIPDPEGEEDNNSDEDDYNNDNKGSCNCVPGEAPSICSKPGSDGVLVAHEHCNKFYKCSYGKNISMRCPGTLLYNPYKEWCDFPENVKCGDRVIPDPEEEDDNNSDEDDNDNKGSYNCVPGEAPSICSKPGSDGVLVAHEHCNKFYKCSHGKNISMRCPGTLLYNPYKEWCDFPENVKCGDRVIPDPEEEDDNNSDEDDNDNKGSYNCVPGEAPSICSKPGSDGVLVAHEHCNKFYKCSHGKNITMRCPGTLLYNPYKEWCDYHENVKCGDRVILDPEEEDDNNSDEDDNDNKGSCNCVPGEAPSICSKPGSDGVLVAHKHCNKFYKCSLGKNITMRCPGTLLYNPYKEFCDFPVNVQCGERIILDDS